MGSRTRRFAPLAGVLYVALMVVLFATPSSPDTNASGAKVISWYSAHHTAARVQELLLVYAALASVVYFASLASYLRRRGADVLATVTIGGGLMAAAGLCIAAGTSEAIVDQYRRLTLAVAQTLNLLSSNVFVFLLFGGVALATTAAGVSMLRTRSMPRAVGVVAIVIGVAAATGYASWFAYLASGLLTLYIAVYLYRRFSVPTEIAMPDVPAARAVPDGADAARSAPTL